MDEILDYENGGISLRKAINAARIFPKAKNETLKIIEKTVKELEDMDIEQIDISGIKLNH